MVTMFPMTTLEELGLLKMDFLGLRNLTVIRRAQEMLMRTDKSVLDIALEAGFSSSSYFGKRFREQCGISPGQFRKRYWEMIKG